MNHFPYEINDVDDDIAEELAKDFRSKFVTVGPQKILLPKRYEQFAEKYYNFPLRTSDVFISGFMRSGTTLTEELVWLLLNDLDVEKARKLVGFNERVPFFEVDIFIPLPNDVRNVTNFDSMTGRRVLKTHLSPSLLPPDYFTCGCKIIFIARNPKDILVSFYHFQLRLVKSIMKCDFETFVGYVMEDKIYPTPFWDMHERYWRQRHSENVMFVFYEDVIKDMKNYIVKLSDFLGKHLTKDELDMLAEHMEFDNFKRFLHSNNQKYFLRELGNEDDGFARKGQCGQSKDYFQGEFGQRVDKWIRDNLERIGMRYPYLD